jgi:hypothetical protein
MHSNIYQISAEKDIEELSTYVIEEQMPFADYIYQTGKGNNPFGYQENPVSLKERIEDFGVEVDKEDNSIIFKKGFKKKYFEEKFKTFKKLSNDLTLESFSGTTSSNGKLHLIEKSFEEKMSSYIHDGYPKTLDEFVRGLTEEKKYYIGEIFGYKW